MRIESRSDHCGRLRGGVEALKELPTEGRQEQEGGGQGEPAPRGTDGLGGDRRVARKLRGYGTTQTEGRTLIEISARDGSTERFFGCERGPAFGTRLQVRLESGGAYGVEFAIEVGMELQFGKLTIHGAPPVAVIASAHCGAADERGPGRT